MRTGLRVALPKGRLLAASTALLRRCSIEPTDGLVHSQVRGGREWTFHFLKMQDIPALVSTGLFDFGIAPDEWIAETEADVVRLLPLGWYHARVCLLEHPASRVRFAPEATRGTGPATIATEYPRLAASYVSRFAEPPRVLRVHGSSEALVPRLADWAIALVETGGTASRNLLKIVDVILECNVQLIANDECARNLLPKGEIAAFSALCAACGNHGDRRS